MATRYKHYRYYKNFSKAHSRYGNAVDYWYYCDRLQLYIIVLKKG